MCSKASSKLKKFLGANSTSRFDVLGPTRKTSESGNRIALTSQLIEDRGSARQDRKFGLIGERLQMARNKVFLPMKIFRVGRESL